MHRHADAAGAATRGLSRIRAWTYRDRSDGAVRVANPGRRGRDGGVCGVVLRVREHCRYPACGWADYAVWAHVGVRAGHCAGNAGGGWGRDRAYRDDRAGPWASCALRSADRWACGRPAAVPGFGCVQPIGAGAGRGGTGAGGAAGSVGGSATLTWPSTVAPSPPPPPPLPWRPLRLYRGSPSPTLPRFAGEGVVLCWAGLRQ